MRRDVSNYKKKNDSDDHNYKKILRDMNART